MNQELQIRSSAAEFLIFQTQEQGNGIQVYYKNETVWLSQKAMAALFDCSTDNIGLHLKNVYEAGELSKEATTEIFSAVQKEGTREVKRTVTFPTFVDTFLKKLTHCQSLHKMRTVADSGQLFLKIHIRAGGYHKNNCPQLSASAVYHVVV